MKIVFGEYMIRDWAVGDAAAIVRHANNRNVARWLRDRFPYPYRLRDAEGFLAAVSQQSPRTAFALATPTEAIGGIGLELGRDVHRFTAELGYWLGEPFWGRGITTRAVGAIVDYAFARFDLVRLYAYVFEGNGASERVLEKNGFACEGVLRQSVFKNGRMLDQKLFALLRPDGFTPLSKR